MKCKQCAVEKETVFFLKKKSGVRMDICKPCRRDTEATKQRERKEAAERYRSLPKPQVTFADIWHVKC